MPLVSAKQMLTWLDGRNASSFGAIAFNGGTLSFTVTKDASANGLQAMLPLRSGSALLLGLTREGATVSYSVNTVKGVDYAFFAAESGSYAATYGVDSTAPVVVSQTPAPGSSGVDVGAAVIASFNEALMASSVNGSTFFLRDAANALVSASISYDSASRTATLRPAAALAASTTYTATLRGGTTDPRIKDVAGNALAANVVWSFTTAAAPPPPSCPCSAWSASTTPTTPQQSDPNAVELGVKFTTSIDGFITGVRFYKGTGNTGTHVGNLWSASGALLARATFSAETASGWQQVNFASPVPVNANTVYVASYYAPNGNYAGDPNFFATSGVSNGPVNLLSNGAAGGNGVYNYSSTTTFPSSTYNATNYWVDIVFSATGTTPPDTTPPTVSSVSPAAGATGVATTTAVSATFSEAMDAATIGASTFELRDAANVLVASNVSYDAPTRTATPDADRGAGGLDDLHGDGARRQRPTARQGRRRQCAGGQRYLELHDRRGAAAAELPVQRLERVDDADHAAGVGPERGRARRQVPDEHQRLHHRRSLLQGHGQHRHPCRQPLERQRRAARAGHLQRRDGVGLAAGELREPGPGEREHRLRRVVLRAERQLRGRRQLLRHERRRQRPGPPAQQRRRRRQRRLRLLGTTAFPSSTFNATNYWVDVVFTPPARHRRTRRRRL